MFYSQKRFTCTLYSAIKIKLLFLVCNVMNLSYILKQIQVFKLRNRNNNCLFQLKKKPQV